MTKEEYISVKRLDGIVLQSLSVLKEIEQWIQQLGLHTKINPSPMGYRLEVQTPNMSKDYYVKRSNHESHLP
jgi:hypothetical protein